MLNERDYELLSAYIDGELNDSERTALERRLSAEADLRRELATLRQTVALVNQLPKLKAPRNFTLEKPVAKTIPFPMTAAFSALSAAAAVLLLIFGGYLLTFSGGNFAAPPAPQASSPLQAVQAPTIVTTQTAFAYSPATATPLAAARDLTSETESTESREGTESQDTQEAAEPESLPSDALLLPTMTALGETATSGQGSAGADQSTQTELFSVMPAPSQLPGETMDAAPAMMQQAAESTIEIQEEQDDEAANSAAGLTLAASPQPSATTTPMPTLTRDLQAADGDVQRTALPTEAPAPTMQPTPIPEQKISVELDSGLIGILSVILGTGLLILALVTTLARRRRKTA